MMALFALLRLSAIWARIRAAAAWIFARRDRALAALCLALAAYAAWQFRRAGNWAEIARQTQAGWDAQRHDAELAKAKAETRYRSLADDADQAHTRDLARGDAALAAYVAAHRMRPAPADPARPAQDHGASLPPIAPAETVLAELSDLRACDADYAYAKAAHDWAISLRP